MASNSNLAFPVFSGLALLLIVLQISTSECSQDRLRQLLAVPTKSSPSLEPCYVAPSEFSHLRKCRKRWLWQLSLLQSLTRSRKAFLLRPGEVLEKHVHIQLSQHLHTHNLLYPLQSGFCSSHSTQTLLLHCLDKWYKALDTKKYVRAVLLDISKAFGTASHELLSKLANLGLSPSATSWF